MSGEQGPPQPTDWWRPFVVAFIVLLVLLLAALMASR